MILMNKYTKSVFCFLICSWLSACSPSPDQATPPNTDSQSSASPDNFSPAAFGNITRERLLNVAQEPGQWLTEGRDIGKTHFSPLDQINLGNITELGLAWECRTETHRGMEANPIVVDGPALLDETRQYYGPRSLVFWHAWHVPQGLD